MAYSEQPFEILKDFIPDNCYHILLHYITEKKIHLKITKERKSVYGDYRIPYGSKGHRISINGNLNQYHFLITFLHELAHLLTYEKFGRKVQSHGSEWKQIFSKLLVDFIALNIFPDDILKALQKYIHHPKASTCADPDLILSLRKYDAFQNYIYLKDLALGSHFRAHNGTEFKLLSQRRTRFEALKVGTNQIYLFPALYELKKPLEN